MTTENKREKVSAIKLIKDLPYKDFAEIASETRVDYKVKKLRGIDLIVDLILAMLSSSQVSQRIVSLKNELPVFSDILGTPDANRMAVSHSSLSERLDKVNIAFFKESYELLCKRYLRFVPDYVLDDMCITRVDSTMVAETANKLQEGFTTGINNGVDKDRRQLKYTMAYNGLNVTCARIFTAQTYSADNAPISKVVVQNLKQKKMMSNCYVFDRGLKDINDLKEIARLSKENNVFFVGRLSLTRCINPIESLLDKDTDLTDNEIEVTDDNKSYLRAKKSTKWDTSTCYRIIHVRFIKSRPRSPRGSRRHARHYDEEMVLITNNFDKEAIEIVRYYKRRWDIEVFFKFLKQDLSFSHFISTNVHGITVMLYMTLIVALLVKIYCITHDMGPRVAKMAIMDEIFIYQDQHIKRLEKKTKEQELKLNRLKRRILEYQKSSDH